MSLLLFVIVCPDGCLCHLQPATMFISSNSLQMLHFSIHLNGFRVQVARKIYARKCHPFNLLLFITFLYKKKRKEQKRTNTHTQVRQNDKDIAENVNIHKLF